MLEDQKILVTGPSSQVGFPVARGSWRATTKSGASPAFARKTSAKRVEAIGVRAVAADLADVLASTSCPTTSTWCSTSPW